MLKKFALAFAFLFAVTSAQAATISTVQKTPGVEAVFGSGLLVSDGLGGFAISGFGFRGPEFWPGIDLSDVTAFGVGSVSGPLAGSPIDVQSAAGVLTALYQTTIGSLNPPADLFLAEFIFSPLEGDSLSTQVAGVQGALTLSAVERINVIPLPATLPLLLAGFGGLAVLRRRRKAA